MMLELKNFSGYYVNGDGWLFKEQKGRVKPLRPLMKFPYGKYPYYVISIKGKKFILHQSALVKEGCEIKGEEKV